MRWGLWGGCSCLVFCPPPPPAATPLAGVGKAMRQLRHALRLVAWLHLALGAQIPPLEGRIVVPAAEVQAAERKLRVASRPVQDWVPGGGGAKFELCIKVASV